MLIRLSAALSFLVYVAVVGAQQSDVAVIGILFGRGTVNDPVVDAMRVGLRQLGYEEGRHYRIEHRSAESHADRLPSLAAELVRLKVDVIVTSTEAGAHAAKEATTSIPIVAVTYDTDPVTAGLIESYNRPGGNITGIFSRQSELIAKRLELIKEALPGVSRVTLFWDAFSPGQRDAIKSAARSLGIQIELQELGPPYDFNAAFRTARRTKAGAVMIGTSPEFYVQRKRIGALALENGLPAISNNHELTAAGGLMSYSNDIRDTFRRVAYYIDRLLKGSKPGELPVEQIERFQLVVNLKTADALGLKIPEPVLLRADEVIR